MVLFVVCLLNCCACEMVFADFAYFWLLFLVCAAFGVFVGQNFWWFVAFREFLYLDVLLSLMFLVFDLVSAC